jgi:hypothetical protein
VSVEIKLAFWMGIYRPLGREICGPKAITITFLLLEMEQTQAYVGSLDEINIPAITTAKSGSILRNGL